MEELGNYRWGLAREAVGGKDEDLELGERSEARGDGAGDQVVAEIQSVEVPEDGEGGRDGACEAVVGEGDDPEVGEPAELWGNPAGDDSRGEDELRQLGEGGDGDRKGAGE